MEGSRRLMEVYLYGKLRRFSQQQDPKRESIVFVKVEKGDTIEDIVESLNIPLNEVGTNIFLNGEYSGLARRVKKGDRLGLFPDDMQLLYRWYFVRKEG